MFFACLLVASCGQPPVEVTDTERTEFEAVFADAAMSASSQEKWARSCALCHVAGEGGAPRMGDMAAWGPRVEKGDAVLMKNTLEGLNRMPPLGYCMDCEVEDFAAMIKMMSGQL